MCEGRLCSLWVHGRQKRGKELGKVRCGGNSKRGQYNLAFCWGWKRWLTCCDGLRDDTIDAPRVCDTRSVSGGSQQQEQLGFVVSPVERDVHLLEGVLGAGNCPVADRSDGAGRWSREPWAGSSVAGGSVVAKMVGRKHDASETNYYLYGNVDGCGPCENVVVLEASGWSH